MNNPDKRLIRIAVKIQRRLQRARSPADQIDDALGRLFPLFDCLNRLRRRMCICAVRNWHGAARQIKPIIDARLRELDSQLIYFRDVLGRRNRSEVTLRELLDELHELDSEFDDLRYDAPANILAVTTEPITLEETRLGRFEIQLHLNRLSEATSQAVVRVVAQDPNPCDSDTLVTHPHVNANVLCAGEATYSIGTALEERRFADVCLLVRSVLTTYNPDSAYRELDQWHEVGCHDCGRSVDRDDSYCCHFCGDAFCDECSLACDECDSNCCYECVVVIEAGKHRVCPTCWEKRENQSEESDEEQSETTNSEPAADTDAALQPDGVGQAAVAVSSR